MSTCKLWQMETIGVHRVGHAAGVSLVTIVSQQQQHPPQRMPFQCSISPPSPAGSLALAGNGDTWCRQWRRQWSHDVARVTCTVVLTGNIESGREKAERVREGDRTISFPADWDATLVNFFECKPQNHLHSSKTTQPKMISGCVSVTLYF